VIGRPAAKTKPEKASRAKRERPLKGERARKPSLLTRLRRPRQRRSLADYSDRALLAQYRKAASSKKWRYGLYALLGILALTWGLAFALTAPFQVMPMIAPLVIVAFLIIWVLPSGSYAPTGAMEPLLLAFLAALVLWPNYIAVALPHMPWLTLLRIIVTPMIIILLVSLSVSARFRRQLGGTINTDPVLWRMLLAFVLLQTFSLALTKDPGLSLNRYFVAQTNQTAIFVVSCFVFTAPGFTERWVRMLLLLAYVACFFGLWENAIAALPWAGHIPPLFKVDGDLVDHVLAGAARSAIGVHRVQSVATTPLGLAELLGLTAPFAVHLMIERRPLVIRLLAAAYLPLALYLILLADSRLGIVALIGAILFYILIWGALQWRRNKDSLLAPALVMVYPAIFTSVILASFFVGKLRNKVWGSGGAQASTDAREAQWKLATPKILTHPLGHGIGQSAGAVGFRSPNGMGTLDSYYITILMDFGVIGFVLFFGLFIRAAWMGGKVVVTLRPRGELTMLLPLVVSLMIFVVIKSVFSQAANHPLVFMMLGAVVALTYRAQTEAQDVYVPKTPSITPR
jgi:hypothetical protein